jgi:hypothetical protein
MSKIYTRKPIFRKPVKHVFENREKMEKNNEEKGKNSGENQTMSPQVRRAIYFINKPTVC